MLLNALDNLQSAEETTPDGTTTGDDGTEDEQEACEEEEREDDEEEGEEEEEEEQGEKVEGVPAVLLDAFDDLQSTEETTPDDTTAGTKDKQGT